MDTDTNSVSTGNGDPTTERQLETYLIDEIAIQRDREASETGSERAEEEEEDAELREWDDPTHETTLQEVEEEEARERVEDNQVLSTVEQQQLDEETDRDWEILRGREAEEDSRPIFDRERPLRLPITRETIERLQREHDLAGGPLQRGPFPYRMHIPDGSDSDDTDELEEIYFYDDFALRIWDDPAYSVAKEDYDGEGELLSTFEQQQQEEDEECTREILRQREEEEWPEDMVKQYDEDDTQVHRRQLILSLVRSFLSN